MIDTFYFEVVYPEDWPEILQGYRRLRLTVTDILAEVNRKHGIMIRYD